VLINWGCIDFECGNYAEAGSRWQEALGILENGPLQGTADPLNNLAVLATVRGQLEEAWTLYERVLSLDEAGPPTPEKMLTYWNMGMLRADQERWDDALELYAQSLALCKETRYLFHQPTIELNRAEALMGKGDLRHAQVACGEALRGYRRLDDALGVADALRLYGKLCRLEGKWNDGNKYLERSIEINRQFGESVSLGEALYELGILRRDQGETTSAMNPLWEAERIFEKAEAVPDLNRVRTILSELETN
jgi:tetratricopeptide (TPR) repeat protein